MWRNRQTRYVQGVVGVTPWEFESPLRHRATIAGQVQESATAHIHMRRHSPQGRGWPLSLRDQRKVRAAQSKGAWRKPGRRTGRPVVDSPHWRALPRESNRDQTGSVRVKRAILPAAISESAVIRLLAEAGSREPPRRRRRGRSLRGPREMTIRNRTRLTHPPLSSHGAYSSIGRALVCGTRGCGIVPR